MKMSSALDGVEVMKKKLQSEIWCVCMENHGLHKLVLPLFKAISHIAKSNPIIIKSETISPKSYSPANSCLCSQLRVLHCISKSLR